MSAPSPRRPGERVTWRPVLAAAALLVVLVATAGPAAAASPSVRVATPSASHPRGRSSRVSCDRAGDRLTLTADAVLDPSCTWTAGVTITASDVTLDCQGATIQGTGVGDGVDVEAPITEPLHDVHVRDCRIQGFEDGVQVIRIGYTTLAAGVEYDHGFSDISIEGSHIADNTNVGVYVDGYVTGVTIRHDDLSGNGSSGIYLDTGSAHDVVADDDIHGNGFVASGPEGTDSVFDGVAVRSWGPGREGLSLDGSRFDRIVGNRFWDNSAGSIFLYKNCGENYIDDAASWLPRRYGSDGNLIERNSFQGGLNGVWVASRMGENTLPMQCSSPAYFEAPLQRVVLDEATDNTIERNTFTDVTYAVHVEDDDTTVAHNTFLGDDPGDYAVVVGTRLRTSVLDHPVTGTRVVGNVSRIQANPSPYRWADGQADTVMVANTALGRRAGICQAPEIPHNPFIMTIAVAAIPPGGPPPPTPDLTVPTIGPLPACPAG